MRIHNLYCDANGESHWRDVEVEWVEERNFSKLSARLPATGIIFRETAAITTCRGTQRRAGNISSISTAVCRSPQAMATRG